MLSKKCTHIRIRDSNEYDFDVDRFINSLQKEYKIDFRSLPRWEKLVQRLHVSTTDCKRKIQDAYLRKALIVQKLYMQSTRPSPFELTDGLCRTAHKWDQLKLDLKRSKQSVIPEDQTIAHVSSSAPLTEEISGTIHPNTENNSVESSENAEVVESKINTAVQAESSDGPSNLPDVIITNTHKLISPMGSQCSGLSYRSLLSEEAMTGKAESEKEEWQYLRPTSAVICTPSTIFVTNDSLSQQVIKFTLTNSTRQFVFVRFRSVLNDSHFQKTKILPKIPKKLCPGLPEVFTFTFKLVNQEELKSSLYFKVGFDVYDNVPAESLCVPIISNFTNQHYVVVSENINIPAVYPWHIKRNDQYSTGYIHIALHDPFPYHVHIYKRVMDFTKEPVVILQAGGVNTEMVTQKIEHKEPDTKSKTSSTLTDMQSELLNVQELAASIAKFIIELALDSFILESTYLYLKPHGKLKIPVYFTKVERTGYHQSYYDLQFIDTETEEVAMKKSVNVYAEVLPHPIKVDPLILDMSKSAVKHGYCEDVFVVSNTHKLYPVTMKIKLTTKMKKMFYVEPMETTVPGSSSVPFAVKFCSRDFLSVKPSEDLVHFTFKIVFFGYKEVYENIPPYFYEVIAPCAVEFKKVYNEKFFIEKDDGN